MLTLSFLRHLSPSSSECLECPSVLSLQSPFLGASTQAFFLIQPNSWQHRRNHLGVTRICGKVQDFCINGCGFVGARIAGSVRGVATVDQLCRGSSRPFLRKHSWFIRLGPTASPCDPGHLSSLSARLPTGKDTYTMQLWEWEDSAGKHLALFQEHGGTFLTVLTVLPTRLPDSLRVST